MSPVQTILKVAVIAAMTVSTSAFYIPKDLPDGTYMHYIDHNGKDVHRRIDDSAARSVALREAHHNLNATYMADRLANEMLHQKRYNPNAWKRYNPSVGITCNGCGDGIVIPSSDTDSANSAIDGQCGDGTELVAGSDYYSKVNEAVAYVCAFQQDQSCTAADRQSTSAQITSMCGEYMPGWETPNIYGCENGGSGISYGYDHVENCFCFC